MLPSVPGCWHLSANSASDEPLDNHRLKRVFRSAIRLFEGDDSGPAKAEPDGFMRISQCLLRSIRAWITGATSSMAEVGDLRLLMTAETVGFMMALISLNVVTIRIRDTSPCSATCCTKANGFNPGL